MKFLIVFRYMDGEEFQIEVHPDDMDFFMNTLGKGEVYFNQKRGLGIWVPVDKIRYFHVEKVDEKGRRIMEGDSEVSHQNRGDKGSKGKFDGTGMGCMGGVVPSTKAEA